VHDVTFMHVQPTVATLRAQNRLRGLQGRDGIWFAGGYLYPFDAQETALRSALEVTFGMQLTSQRATALRYAALEAQGGRTTSDPLEGLTRLT
jgi:predicted NAD/FAD-binding protein